MFEGGWIDCPDYVEAGWRLDGDGWAAPVREMSKYDFVQRLTPSERVQMAKLRDTNAELPPDQKDYSLADFFELWDLVQDVRTDNADTIAGITTICTALGWSEERLGEILQA